MYNHFSTTYLWHFQAASHLSQKPNADGTRYIHISDVQLSHVLGRIVCLIMTWLVAEQQYAIWPGLFGKCVVIQIKCGREREREIERKGEKN